MRRKNIEQILKLLHRHYPDADILLPKNRFHLLVSTILSAQSRDKQTIAISKKLFKRYKSAEALSKAKQSDVEDIIRNIGLYKTKAKRIIEVSKIIAKNHGRVPDSMEELLKLPGVGRKTANIVLGKGFGKSHGIAVDTHVFRISRRLGLSNASTSYGVEKDLMKQIPKNYWVKFTDLMIAHGRKLCRSKKPLCNKCFLAEICDYARTNAKN